MDQDGPLMKGSTFNRILLPQLLTMDNEGYDNYSE